MSLWTVAVVVGVNRAPGQRALRNAENDAREIGHFLAGLGGPIAATCCAARGERWRHFLGRHQRRPYSRALRSRGAADPDRDRLRWSGERGDAARRHASGHHAGALRQRYPRAPRTQRVDGWRGPEARRWLAPLHRAPRTRSRWTRSRTGSLEDRAAPGADGW